MEEIKLDKKDTIELVVNAGLQLIPYVGGSLSTLYFGYKQEQRFKRIEQTMKEVAEELEGVKLAKVEEHNADELMALIDEITDKIENERLEAKRKLYKEYFKKILITPTNGNYEERKMFLEVLAHITPLQIELFQYVLTNPNVLDVSIYRQGTDQSLIKSSLLQLQNNGLIIATLNSISIGGPNSGMPMKLMVSEFGRKFNEFCLR